MQFSVSERGEPAFVEPVDIMVQLFTIGVRKGGIGLRGPPIEYRDSFVDRKRLPASEIPAPPSFCSAKPSSFRRLLQGRRSG
ncbi:hypothetical protein [Ensifer aridi]|uniref:hypothetical protein n=1 Tax=Ensifer aridi TaxID=1708715 RepID=UPI00111BDE14|nr:hypothetical protein [Ensifer aridi]